MKPIDEYAPARHWDECPRGVLGGVEAHKAQVLTHRIIEGRLCCMNLQLAREWDAR